MFITFILIQPFANLCEILAKFEKR